MRRLFLISFVVILVMSAAPAFAQNTIPLEGTVPDAAVFHFTPEGLDFFSDVATNIVLAMNIEELLMQANPLMELECTNLLIMYIEMEVNIASADFSNSTVELSTESLMGLPNVQDGIYVKLSLAPAPGESMILIELNGSTGSSGCGEDPLDASADITFAPDPLEIGAVLTVDYEAPADGLLVELVDLAVDFTDIQIEFTGLPSGLDEWLEELVGSIIGDLIEEMAPELINQLIEEQLGDLVLEGTMPVGDYTLSYAFDPDFTTGNGALDITTDGHLFIEGTTIDPCIDDGTQTGSPWTVNPLPAFGNLTPGGEEYHFGLALGDDLLNQLLYSFLAKGELCLMFPWELDEGREFTFGALGGVLAEWSELGDWEDAGNLLDMYPLDMPKLVVGQGNTDLALIAQPYHLDWYVQREDRYVAMMNVDINLNLSLSMATDEFNNLIVTLEGSDFSFDVTGTEFNILPAELIEATLNAVMNFILPSLVDILPPIPLPEILEYQFTIDEIGAMGSGDDYFGLYCAFVPPTAKAPAPGFDLPGFGVVTQMNLDAAASARAGLAATAHPVLRLAGSDTAAIDHYRVRIDNGFWRIVRDGVVDLTYFAEGRHKVEAIAVSPQGKASDKPARLSFVIDRVAPRLDRAELVRKALRRTLVLAAHDYVAASDELRFQVRVGDGEWSAPFAATRVPVPTLPDDEIVVRAVDPAGNTSAPQIVRTRATAPRAPARPFALFKAWR